MLSNLTNGYFDAGGPFSLNVSSDGKSVIINRNSLLLSSFNPADRVDIVGLDKPINYTPDLKVWIEVYLDNASGNITAEIKSGASWWDGGACVPYLIDSTNLDGIFQGQTNIYAPIASVSSEYVDMKDGIMRTNDGFVYRYLRQDLMIVQFCDKYALLPIGIGIRY